MSNEIKVNSGSAIVSNGAAGSYPVQRGYTGYLNELDATANPADYLRILAQSKWKILGATVGATVLALVATLPQTRLYEAKVKVEIESLNEDFLNMRQVSPIQQASAHEMTPLGDIPTQMEILKSQTVVDQTGLRFDAKYVSRRQRKSKVKQPDWEQLVSFWNRPKPTQREEALTYAVQSLKVKAIPETRIIEITTESTDPQLAAHFLNTLTTEYIKQNMEIRWNMNHLTQEWLGTQLEDMRKKLEGSEGALQNYVRTAGLVVVDENGPKISEDHLRNIQNELNHAQADRATQEARYEIAKTARPETLSDVVDSALLKDYATKATDLHQKLAEASATFAPNSANVKRIRVQVAEVEAALLQSRNSLVARIQNDYEQVKRREAILQREYDLQAKRVSQDAERSIHYNVLKREVDSNRHLYEAMLQQVKEASVASAIHATNARVVDSAEIPDKPSRPRRILWGLLGLVLGLSISAGVVLKHGLSDRSILTAEEANAYLGLTALGNIPSIKPRRRGLFASAKRTTEGMVLALAKRAEPEEEGGSANSIDVLFVESFRSALTSILFSGENGNPPRVLVVSSVNPGEGKSTVTANLGVSLAESGNSVLLIDGDMRNPQLDRSFEVSGDSGLSTYLRDAEAIAGPVLPRLIQKTCVPNLTLLPAGPVTSAGTSLLYSPRLAALIEEARQSFDLVLIDTPPMLAMPDARVIGRLSDAVVLVIRSKKTSRDVLRSICQRLGEDGTRVLGAILNDWDPNAAARGSSYSYASTPASLDGVRLR